MASLDPTLGAQIFEIDPYRVRRTRRHGLEVAVGKPHPESFDDDVRGATCGTPHPSADFDPSMICSSARDPRGGRGWEAGKDRSPTAGQIVPFRRQLTRETQHTPISPKLSTTEQKMSQVRVSVPRNVALSRSVFRPLQPGALFRDGCRRSSHQASAGSIRKDPGITITTRYGLMFDSRRRCT